MALCTPISSLLGNNSTQYPEMEGMVAIFGDPNLSLNWEGTRGWSWGSYALQLLKGKVPACPPFTLGRAEKDEDNDFTFLSHP